MIELTDERLERYSRNILLKEVGIEGQEKLFNGKVLVIGTGGLGSPAALYLSAAGVGRIGIADSDNVELSNLQRQIIHFTSDIGRPKVESAKEKMTSLNPDIEVKTHHLFVNSSNIAELISDYDFVIDGTDNFPAKFLINDACVLARKPFSHAGILRFDGQTMTIKPYESACVRCIFNKPPPRDMVSTCSQAGIIGGVAGLFGTLQALEAIKFLLGNGQLLTNRMLVCNALDTSFREVKVKRNPNCPICGKEPTITELHDEEAQVCDLKNAE